MHMNDLQLVKLHLLIGTRTVWTDELWEDCREYVESHTGNSHVMLMFQFLYGGAKYHRPMTKEAMLGHFREWPPTVLLGAFDRMRSLPQVVAALAAAGA